MEPNKYARSGVTYLITNIEAWINGELDGRKQFLWVQYPYKLIINLDDFRRAYGSYVAYELLIQELDKVLQKYSYIKRFNEDNEIILINSRTEFTLTLPATIRDILIEHKIRDADEIVDKITAVLDISDELAAIKDRLTAIEAKLDE